MRRSATARLECLKAPKISTSLAYCAGKIAMVLVFLHIYKNTRNTDAYLLEEEPGRLKSSFKITFYGLLCIIIFN
jgi:hypothetical protein